MTENFGTCRYCGQGRIIRGAVGDNLLQEDLDEIASGECDCEEAQFRRRQNEQVFQIKKAIEEECGASEALKSILQALAEKVGREVIEEGSIKVGKRKYQICLTGKGALRFKVTETEQKAVEA